jgi:N6-adenosine-specific RNA methylase IME4
MRQLMGEKLAEKGACAGEGPDGMTDPARSAGDPVGDSDVDVSAGKQTGLAFHPLADLFPLIEDDEFDELRRDIVRNGLRERIVVHEEKILDGRNRYRACLDAKIFKARTYGAMIENGRFKAEFQPYFTTLPRNEDPLGFVISKNLKRRHLGAGQRAALADKIANLPAHRPEKCANLRTSQSAAAKTMHVSRRSVQFAKVVRIAGVPALQEAVAQGKISVSEAVKAAKLTPTEQERVAELAKAGQRNVVHSVIKQQERRDREDSLGQQQATDNRTLPLKRYGVILAEPTAVNARAVEDGAAKDCVLFVWATVPMLPDALEFIRARSFSYITHFAWTKSAPGTGPWNRNRHELLLVGTKGDVPAPAPGTLWDSIVTAEQSEKPDSAYRLIEDYFPTLPRAEVGARRVRDGWDSIPSLAQRTACACLGAHSQGGASKDGLGTYGDSGGFEHTPEAECDPVVAEPPTPPVVPQLAAPLQVATEVPVAPAPSIEAPVQEKPNNEPIPGSHMEVPDATEIREKPAMVEITRDTPEWAAWRRLYERTGQNALCAAMDNAASGRNAAAQFRFCVPERCPPGEGESVWRDYEDKDRS